MTTTVDPASRELVEVMVSELHEHPENPRTHFVEQPDLVKSIKEKGVLTAPIVMPAGNEGDGYIVLAGARRRRAAIKAGIETVVVDLRIGLSRSQIVDLLALDNENRSDLVPSEEAAAVALLIGDGRKVADIAKAFGKSAQWVKERVALMALPKQVRVLFDPDKDGDEGWSLKDAPGLLEVHGEDPTILVDWMKADVRWRAPWEARNLLDAKKATAKYDETLSRLEKAGETVFTTVPALGGAIVITAENSWDTPRPGSPVLLVVDDADAVKAHRKESCHASFIQKKNGSSVKRWEVCTDPSNHKTKGDSEIKSKVTRSSSSTSDVDAKAERARLKEDNTRQLEAMQSLLKAPKKSLDLMLDGAIARCSSDAAKLAVMLLGIEKPKPGTGAHHSIGYACKDLIEKAAKESKAMRDRAALAVEISERTAYSPDSDVTALLKEHGYKPIPKKRGS